MSKNQSTILVTGGAGYIGSHAVQCLQRAGYEVIVLDNLVYGHRDIVEKVLGAQLIVGDISDRTLLDNLFATYPITAVMHFAAYAYVGESIIYPAKYYRNNIIGTLTLLEAMVDASVKKLVFSSTCATYGLPQQLPIPEHHPQNPINPYGLSKLTVEKILADFDRAYGLKSIIFRYFNAAGADPDGYLGEDHAPETHLIPLILLTALGQRENITIFGADYPTPDGICIRDYIHVSDLAQAHRLGLEYLLSHDQSDIFNLGNGNGFSVRKVIKTAKQVTQMPIKFQTSQRRTGDPAILVGSSERARHLLGWKPKYAKLDEIITHAWKWHQYRHPNSQRSNHSEILAKVS